ncbi:ABC transporter permease [Promicromonospora thailandica]|uniref:Peptide/nickel transport system permease protein n=1 Tax=Promicromonospora thailandica TaxID=765201 RepID=A0A9X2JU87_9MICO|nr:ABC transporter permease [Promicromonospora thailandica]MCP2263207.1 peptide/nickel transport system permease protein [Promicromonospora thailandica]
MTGLRRFAANRLAVVGAVALLLLVLFAVLGPLVHPTEQVTTDLGAANLPPGADGHPLGTDALGYDNLGRLMVAGRVSLLVGVLAGALATVVGTLWGAVAGYVGGVVDAVMMRVVDAGIAIPAIFLLLVLSTIVRPTVGMMIVVLGLVSWLVPARLIRAEALSVRTRDYVVAARAMGATHSRTVLSHVIPNTVGTVVVNATFQVADAILLVAYISFLGMGVQPPTTDWGAMLNDGISYIYQGAWWLILPPGLAIVIVVCALNFVGDGLRDVVDVRGRAA